MLPTTTGYLSTNDNHWNQVHEMSPHIHITDLSDTGCLEDPIRGSKCVSNFTTRTLKHQRPSGLVYSVAMLPPTTGYLPTTDNQGARSENESARPQ